MNKPVLFIIFNREHTALKVFEQIRKAKPPRFYLASDGPRLKVKEEKKIVENLRKIIINKIDWKCEVKTLFQKNNLGCGKAVSTAITWFFKEEKDGIILEDDCLPHPTFFNFCEVLLDHYKDNKQIMHISGDQFSNNTNNPYSYYFSKIMHCWGWASWSDRWAKYKYNLDSFNEQKLINFSSNQNVQLYWKNILYIMKKHQNDTWDYQWTFSIVENNGFCINPTKNLISNIGFNSGGTHTYDSNNEFANMKTYPTTRVKHPPKILIDEKALNYIYKNHYKITLYQNNNLILKLLHKIKYFFN